VFDKYVRQPYFEQSCVRMHCTIPECELIASWENGGMCSWCVHMSAKDD